MLGIEQEYTHFDQDIIIDINSVLMILTQIGVGPETGFSITGENETWSDFLPDTKGFESIKSFIYLKVRILFDPPTSSIVMEAMERQIKEFEWRLNVNAESVTTTTTTTTTTI
jgi:hypothetical protein